jgi:integrase
MAARKRSAARRNWPDNLYVNSEGYYWFKHPVTKKGFGLGRDFKAAAQQVRTVNAELERRKGETSLLNRIDTDEVSLRAWTETFEKARETINPHTLAGIRAGLNALREETRVVDQPISRVTPKQIAEVMQKIETARGPSAAHKFRGTMLEVFREAIERGLIEVGKNPVSAVYVPEMEVKRMRLTLDDYKAIHAQACLRPADRWIANAIELALVSGQRREDIGKMQFSQIQDGYLLIEQSKGRDGQRAKLRIPLSLRLDAIGVTLEQVLQRCRDNVLSKSVIHLVQKTSGSKPGDAPSLPYMSKRFAALRDDAEIPVDAGRTPATFHELRSLAARLYTEQYGAEFAQALLGHKSAEMTALYRDSRGREWTEIKVAN